MVDKEIKVHLRVIQMIFTMIQMAKYDRPVQIAYLFYDNDIREKFSFRRELYRDLLTCAQTPTWWDSFHRGLSRVITPRYQCCTAKQQGMLVTVSSMIDSCDNL